MGRPKGSKNKPKMSNGAVMPPPTAVPTPNAPHAYFPPVGPILSLCKRCGTTRTIPDTGDYEQNYEVVRDHRKVCK